MLDVTNSTYYRILTTQQLTDSSTSQSTTLAASALNANNISTYAQASFAKANSASSAASAALNSVTGTTGSATPATGVITFAGANGVSAVGASNTVTFSTPQDIRTTATPSFAGLNINGIVNNYGNVSANGYIVYANSVIANTILSTSSSRTVSLGVNTPADTANSGSIVATGRITAYYSDERLKINLGNIPDALNKVSSLNGFYYEANDIAKTLGFIPKREVGVSAQQVQNVLPEVVYPAPIDGQYLTVDYERIVPLLIEAIKELKQEIDSLKNP
jgi:hypothetical protein